MLPSLSAPPPHATKQANNDPLVEDWSTHPATLPPKRGTESTVVAKAISLLNKTPAAVKRPEQASLDTPPSSCAPPAEVKDEPAPAPFHDPAVVEEGLMRPPIVPSQTEDEWEGGRYTSNDVVMDMFEDPTKAFFAAHFPSLPVTYPGFDIVSFHASQQVISHPLCDVKMEENDRQLKVPLPLQDSFFINACNGDGWWTNSSNFSSCPSSSNISQTELGGAEEWMSLIDLTNTADTPTATLYPGYAPNPALKEEPSGEERLWSSSLYSGAGATGPMQFAPPEPCSALAELPRMAACAQELVGCFGAPPESVFDRACLGASVEFGQGNGVGAGLGAGLGASATPDLACDLAPNLEPRLASHLASNLALPSELPSGSARLSPLATSPATNIASTHPGSHSSLQRTPSPHSASSLVAPIAIHPTCGPSWIPPHHPQSYSPSTGSSSTPASYTPISAAVTSTPNTAQSAPKHKRTSLLSNPSSLYTTTTLPTSLSHPQSAPLPPPKPTKPTSLTCPHLSCGKTFSSTHNLQEHAQVHRFPRSRDYLCQDCGSLYFYKRDLQRHIRKKHKVDKEDQKGESRRARVVKLANMRIVQSQGKGKKRGLCV